MWAKLRQLIEGSWDPWRRATTPHKEGGRATRRQLATRCCIKRQSTSCAKNLGVTLLGPMNRRILCQTIINGRSSSAVVFGDFDLNEASPINFYFSRNDFGKWSSRFLVTSMRMWSRKLNAIHNSIQSQTLWRTMQRDSLHHPGPMMSLGGELN